MPRKLRICYLSQEYPPETGWGGIATYTRIMAQSMAQRGHTVHVISRSPGPNSYMTLDGQVVIHRVFWPQLLNYPANVPYPYESACQFYARAVAMKALELHKSINFDVIEAPDFAAEGLYLDPTAFPFQVVRLHSGTMFTTLANALTPTLGEMIVDRLEELAAHKAQLITAPSQIVLDRTDKLWGKKFSQAEVIPNPFDVNLFRPETGKLKYPYAEPILLYVGRIERQKGVATLIRAMKKIIVAIPGMRLTMIGRDTTTGPGRTSMWYYLTRLINQEGIPWENIRAITQIEREELIGHYQNAAICVLPSVVESFSYTSLEALGCGVPTILTNTTGAAEYGVAGRDFLAISPEDPDQLADAVISLYADSSLRARMAGFARELIETRFNQEQIAADMEKLFLAHLPAPINVTSPQANNTAPKLAILILAHNALEYTKRCVSSLKKYTDLPYKIYVLDNASTDQTWAWLQSVPDVTALHSDINSGVPKGRNLLLAAIKDACDYVVFLDNDVEVFAGWWRPFIEVFQKHKEAGAVGANGYNIVITNDDERKLYSAGGDGEQKCDIITGYCMFVRKSVVDEIGPFDENLGSYWHDDDDYSVRIIGQGYSVMRINPAPLIHYGSKSSSTVPDLLKIEGSKRNLKYLINKWRRLNILDQDGRPCARGNINVVWEGSQFVYHSLALVNRELCLQLLKHDNINLSIKLYEPHQFNSEVDSRFRALEARFASTFTKPVDIHIRHQWPPNFTPPAEGKWVMIQPWEHGAIPREWLTPMITQVDEIWTPSEYNRQCYIRNGIPANKVQAIPLGVNPEIFKPEGERLILPTRKRWRFLFVGGTIYRKGIDILLQAYHETFSDHDDVALIIKDFGADSFYKGQTLNQHTLNQGEHAPEIVYLNQTMSMQEIVNLYRACNCLVHPYRGEGFGLPIAEAMACGLPVIVPQHGACLDYCHDETAYLVRAKEVIAPQHQVQGNRTS